MAFDLEKIRETAVRVAASYGLEVVDLELLGGTKNRLLRVTIEKDAAHRAAAAEHPGELQLPPGVRADQLAGITVEDCEQFSQDFGTVLDVNDLIPGSDYSLEVSSPGLDRKLRTKADFERFTGSLAKIRTASPVDGNSHWQGRIVDVTADAIMLEIPSPKGKKSKAEAPAPRRLVIPLTNIVKANLEPEF
jgi:ribosome maturation factor RimP